MKFTESHEWIQKSQSKGTVGVTEYAQKELGDIVYIELPKVGSRIKAGEEVCVVESTKAAADIYSPVSGKILSVNEKLKENPSLINASPEKEGWLFTIEMSSPEEYDDLLDAFEYESMIS